jgi:hypothetical protein
MYNRAHGERKGFLFHEGGEVLAPQWVERIGGEHIVVCATWLFEHTNGLHDTRMVLVEKKIKFYEQVRTV